MSPSDASTILVRRAVTLLELLVTVAATIVLTTILIVTIRGVRGQTLVMQDLNNLRLSAQDMLAWSAENDDKFLNLEAPDSPVDRAIREANIPASLPFWDRFYSQPNNWNYNLGMLTTRREQHWHSPYGLPDAYANTPGTRTYLERLRESGNPLWVLSTSRYKYTLTLVTFPELWDGATRISDTDDLSAFSRGVRLSNVRYPSGKGMLSHHGVPESPGFFHAAFVDGSAAREDTHSPSIRFHSPFAQDQRWALPVQDTFMGYEGTDR